MRKISYSKNEATNWLIPNHYDLFAFLIVIFVISSAAIGISQMVAPFSIGYKTKIYLDIKHLPIYALRTVLRLFIAMGFSLIFTFIFGSLAAKNRRAEKVIVPIIDILQSAPVLSYLTITTPFFIALFKNSMLGPECAAMFAVFTAQAWNMALSFYQSLKTLPAEMSNVSKIFGLSKWQKFWRIEVPYSMSGLLWNMMMSMSGSWFFITASEAFPLGDRTVVLPGIGSYISAAITQANVHAIINAIICMFVVIFLYDQLLFRPLIYLSDKFKCEEISDDGKESTSMFVNLLQRTNLLKRGSAIFDNFADRFVNMNINLNVFGTIKSMVIVLLTKTHEAIFSDEINRVKWYNVVSAKEVDKSQEHTNLQRISLKKIALYVFFGLIFAVVVWKGFLYVTKVVEYREILIVSKLGFFTFLRVITLIISVSLFLVPVGVYIGLRPRLASKIQPIIQFLAAFPTNLLFPIAAMLILKFKFNIETCAAPLMVMGTQWYILFNVIAGASCLPSELKQVVTLMDVTGWLKWRRFILPGIAPYFVTGAITACGGAWNASIVAEVIVWHDVKLKATGLGAYIVDSFTNNDVMHVALGTIVMCSFVVLINRTLWRPLYRMAAERYNIGGNAEGAQ